MMYLLNQTVGSYSTAWVAILNDGCNCTIPFAATAEPHRDRFPRPSVCDQRRLWREQAAQQGKRR